MPNLFRHLLNAADLLKQEILKQVQDDEETDFLDTFNL